MMVYLWTILAISCFALMTLAGIANAEMEKEDQNDKEG